MVTLNGTGYLVWCDWTHQLWFAHDKKCLNMNFIYRDDLTIQEVSKPEDVTAFYEEHGRNYNPGIIASTVCYILDNPPNESYEVYYQSAMPSGI